jgi:hypothetical protein
MMFRIRRIFDGRFKYIIINWINFIKNISYYPRIENDMNKGRKVIERMFSSFINI